MDIYLLLVPESLGQRGLLFNFLNLAFQRPNLYYTTRPISRSSFHPTPIEADEDDEDDGKMDKKATIALCCLCFYCSPFLWQNQLRIRRWPKTESIWIPSPILRLLLKSPGLIVPVWSQEINSFICYVADSLLVSEIRSDPGDLHMTESSTSRNIYSIHSEIYCGCISTSTITLPS